MNQGIRLWVVLVVACVALAVGIAVIGAEAAVIISLSRAQTQMSQNILAEREARLAAVAHLVVEKARVSTLMSGQQDLAAPREDLNNRLTKEIDTLKSRVQAMQIANDQLEARIGALQTRNTVLEQTISSLQAEKQRLLEKLNGAPAAKTP